TLNAAPIRPSTYFSGKHYVTGTGGEQYIRRKPLLFKLLRTACRTPLPTLGILSLNAALCDRLVDLRDARIRAVNKYPAE
ncbi:MAG: hypothetical protein OXM02_01035, partial [Bacteroidota bacterium]|nr:hypothetical protein [Bacteroidota bacterium]